MMILNMGKDNAVTLEALEALLERKLAPLRDTMGSLSHFLNHKFDSMEAKVVDLEKMAKVLDRKNKFLRAEVSRLKKIISEVEDAISDIQQYTRREYVEIAGIPVPPGENTNDISIKAGSLMGLELDERESHRLPAPSYSSRMRNPRPSSPASSLQLPQIIVKFARRDTKDKFYKLRQKATEERIYCRSRSIQYIHQ